MYMSLNTEAIISSYVLFIYLKNDVLLLHVHVNVNRAAQLLYI